MTHSAAKLISSRVVYLPREKRKLDLLCKSFRPIAFKTCEGSGFADVHAEPADIARSGIRDISLEPSNP